MGSDKGSISGRFQTGAFSAQFVFDILLSVSIIWLFVQNCGLNSEVKVLKNEVVELKERQNLLEQIRVSDERNENRSAEGMEKREVINQGSLTIADLLKQGIQGPPGAPGKDGTPGRDGRDAVNFAAVDKHIKISVSQAVDVEMGKVQLAVKSVPTISGATYIRYGRTSCPSKSSLIYKGRLGGTEHNQNGGAAQYICMPDDPEYGPAVPTMSRLSHVAGTEYIEPNTKLFKKSLEDQNAPCAVCQTIKRSIQFMIPAKLQCPDDSWTLEYQGYLMSHDYRLGSRTEYVCVDSHPELVPGMQGKVVSAELLHTTANCPSLGNCPPYITNRELTCVVCSK